jgi:uncharacterized protein (TIGR00369 family)
MSSLLDNWLESEQALRACVAAGVGLPPLTADEMLNLDGLSIMRAMRKGRSQPPSMSKTLDFMLIEVEHGRAVFQGTPGPTHLNPMGGVHGGWYAAMLDSALGCSVHCALPAGKAYTTLELKLNIVRAITPGPAAQRVRAEGRVIHVGGQTATADARLVGPDGKLYAHGSTTCLVFDMRERLAAKTTTWPAAAAGSG